MRLVSCSLLATLVSLTGCRSSLPDDPPQTVESVDLQAYVGLWYEVARLPVPFQDDEDLATANYVLQEDEGVIALVNTAIAPDGTTESVTGTAVPVPGTQNTQLRVTIDNFFAKLFGSPPEYGNYWVLKLDDAYSVALVGSPDRKTMWILARNPEIPEDSLRAYLQHAEEQGFDTSDVIVNNGDFPPAFRPEE